MDRQRQLDCIPVGRAELYLARIQLTSYLFNASHAVCVALDSLYGAYLKAHYPLEFYTALLSNYAQKGDKDRIS